MLELPLFLRVKKMGPPAWVKEQIITAVMECYRCKGVHEDDREAAGYVRAYLLWYSWAYYRGKPLTRDDDWDAMYRRLQWYEEQWPQLITPLSPTQRVGGIQKPSAAVQSKSQDHKQRQ